jgi:hypothetical protein
MPLQDKKMIDVGTYEVAKTVVAIERMGGEKVENPAGMLVFRVPKRDLKKAYGLTDEMLSHNASSSSDRRETE